MNIYTELILLYVGALAILVSFVAGIACSACYWDYIERHRK